jgi:aspartate aminotransferase-like enzyme
MDLDIDGWGLDVVIGGSQKALAIPPGLAFASVSAAALERSAQATSPRYYFSYVKEKAAADKGDASWTPSTALVLALAKSLEYVREIGRENLIANAARLAAATRAAAAPMHLRVFASQPSPAVTALCPPVGLDAGRLIHAMQERFGIILAGGQGSMKGKIFRLAHLGYYDFPELVGCLASMEIVLRELGHPCELGAGVRAAQAVFETTDAHR